MSIRVPVLSACLAILAGPTPSLAAAAAPDDIGTLRERATALAARSILGYALENSTIALFAERAFIRVEDASRIARAKYEGLAACGVKSWQAAPAAVEREMLESVVAGRLVRADAAGYRGALAEKMDADHTLDPDSMNALEDASLGIYAGCEGEVDRQFERDLAEAQAKSLQLLRSASGSR